MGARVYGGPKWTVSPVYEGLLKEEMDAAAARRPQVPYQPLLIDATYAGLFSGAADAPLEIPALNRDGDCLSDLVLPMFGSIAGAESVLLAFDENYQTRVETRVAMAEAPHGTAPALRGKDLANPLAMILACGALLRHAADQHGPEAERAARSRYTRRRSRQSHPGSRRRISAVTPALPSSPRRHWVACEQSSRARLPWGAPRETACSALFWRPIPAVRFRPRPPLLYRTYVPVFS